MRAGQTSLGARAGALASAPKFPSARARQRAGARSRGREGARARGRILPAGSNPFRPSLDPLSLGPVAWKRREVDRHETSKDATRMARSPRPSGCRPRCEALHDGKCSDARRAASTNSGGVGRLPQLCAQLLEMRPPIAHPILEREKYQTRACAQRRPAPPLERGSRRGQGGRRSLCAEVDRGRSRPPRRRVDQTQNSNINLSQCRLMHRKVGVCAPVSGEPCQPACVRCPPRLWLVQRDGPRTPDLVGADQPLPVAVTPHARRRTNPFTVNAGGTAQSRRFFFLFASFS